jgi:hypothetical protein
MSSQAKIEVDHCQAADSISSLHDSDTDHLQGRE